MLLRTSQLCTALRLSLMTGAGCHVGRWIRAAEVTPLGIGHANVRIGVATRSAPSGRRRPSGLVVAREACRVAMQNDRTPAGAKPGDRSVSFVCNARPQMSNRQ